MLIYSLAELYHLPALIFILIFGLTIANLQRLTKLPLISKFFFGSIEKEVTRFQRDKCRGYLSDRIPSFFLVFGFMIETSEILDPGTLKLAFFIVFIILPSELFN